VFAREGRPRLPIRKLYGPSIAGQAKAEGSEAVKEAQRVAQEVFAKRLQHEVGRLLSKGSK
jgi:hypothetical protein